MVKIAKTGISEGVTEVGNIVLKIIMLALIMGSILGATVFSTITIVNVTLLSEVFSAFVVAVTGFIVVGGTLLGILWILPYIKPLFKKDALGMSA